MGMVSKICSILALCGEPEPMLAQENVSSVMTRQDFLLEIKLNPKAYFPDSVTPLLLGMKESIPSNKAEQILSDAGVRYRYEDILNKDSRLAEMMQAIAGSLEVPQLLVGGDSYVGIEQIRRYIG